MSPGFASHSRPHPQRDRIFESKPANDADRHLPPRPSAISQSRLYCLSGPMRPTQAGHHRPDRLTAVHEASRVRSLPHRHKYFSRLLAGFRLPVNRRNPAHSVPPRFATASPRLRIGNLNTFFHRPQLYRRPGKRSIARCSMKTPLSRWPFAPFTGPHRLWPTPFDRFARARAAPDCQRRCATALYLEDQAAWNSASNRAGACDGARAGKPRCVSILTITAGSSMAAMIFNSPPHCGQCSWSIPNTRLSRRAQPGIGRHHELFLRPLPMNALMTASPSRAPAAEFLTHSAVRYDATSAHASANLQH